MYKMMKLCMFSCLMLASTMIFADCMSYAAPQQDGFFLGLGGSYNTLKFEQDYSAVGIGEVFDDNETLVAVGEAGGAGAPFSEIICGFAPEIQAGYYRHFDCSCSFWGIKYLYQYLDITSIDKLIDTPQSGFLDPQGGSLIQFTGNVITKSAQTDINHEMVLLAFLGHSFENSRIYLGAGPCVFGTKSNIFQVFGFANRDGFPQDATGTPVSFSSSKWVWGGAAQIGVTYELGCSWFLDFNYTYAITTSFQNHYSAPFSTTLVGDYTDVGTLFVDTKRQIRSQVFCITINKAFCL